MKHIFHLELYTNTSFFCIMFKKKVGVDMNKFEKYGNVVWMDGALIHPKEANTSIFAHAMHYASSWFEGIRTYKTDKGTAVLLLDEHTERMFASPKLYRRDFSQDFTFEQIRQAIIDVVRENQVGDAYVRPVMFLGMDWNALMPSETIEHHAFITTWELTHLFSGDVFACISPRPRISDDAIPMQSKCAGNYTNSLLIKMEAIEAGYDDGIALDSKGNVSEASTANIFIIKKDKIFTPSLDCSVLNGLTRQLTIKMARELLNLEVIECHLKPDDLFQADEMFMTGSAAGIIRISHLDGEKIGEDAPITAQLQKLYAHITSGHHPWSDAVLTYLD